MALLDAPTTDSLLATVAARAGDPGLVHVERLPARDARHSRTERPIHAAVDERLRERAIGDLWSHQARGDRPHPGRSLHRHRHRDGIGQVALLPGADRRGGDRPRRAGHAPCSCSHQGPRPGPAARGHVRSGSPGWSPPPTTATRRPTSGPGRAATPTCVLSNPDMVHGGLLPHHAAGPRSSCACATSSWTSSTCCAACSAPTSPTCCDGCAEWRRCYGAEPTFVFCSATIGQPGRLAVRAVRPRRRRGRRRRLAARRADGRALEPAARVRRRRLLRCHPTPSPRTSSASWSGRGIARWRSAGAAGAPRSWRPRWCGATPTSWGSSALTAAATWPPSGERSRPSSSVGGSVAWWPPRPWSWASTSAGSTPACSTASPAPSPRCGSRRGEPAANGRRPWRCSWPATTSSTST